MSELKLKKATDTKTELLTLPMSRSQFERYRRLSLELTNRQLVKLHDLTRERIDILLNEIESVLAKSS